MIPPYKAVNEHHTTKLTDTQLIVVIYSIRPNKKIPAETSVAEWINAEAGTGASIESGSHTWKPNCADLQNEQINRPAVNKLIIWNVPPNKPTQTFSNKYKLVKLNVNVFGKKTIKTKNDTINDTSLSLLKKNALNALLAVPILVVQKLINKNEKHPINSHPNIKVGKFPEAKSKIILIKNIYNKFKKFKIRGSFRI